MSHHSKDEGNVSPETPISSLTVPQMAGIKEDFVERAH
jgi:hypothetical protein